MTHHNIKIKRGLDLPITGRPRQFISSRLESGTYALLGSDFPDLKPSLAVKVGDKVQKGQTLLVHRQDEAVKFVAPAAGTITAVERGARRALQSVVIAYGGTNQVSFRNYEKKQIDSYGEAEIRALLLESGLWTSLRARPYGKIAHSQAKPRAILINAMDTNPLAADPEVFIGEHREAYRDGVRILAKLTPRLRVCARPGSSIPVVDGPNMTHHTFSGPHPAGLSGTHVHYLEPVGAGDQVWTANYADVVAIGHLFRSGEWLSERVISIAGPKVKSPTLYRVQMGSNTEDLTRGLLHQGQVRVVSGSVLSGHHAQGALGYLGRYDLQLSALEEGTKRELLGWQRPGLDKFSTKRVYLGGLMPWRLFDFTTSTEGSHRAIVPIGMYEKVLPQDTQATFLVRALASHDVELAVEMGALEMDEEDMGLLSFVCPGKHNYGDLLRQVLRTHEREG